MIHQMNSSIRWWRLWLGLTGLAVGLLMGMQAFGQATTFNPPYPRLAAHQISNWNTYDEQRIQLIAKHDVAILGLWRTWKGGGYDLATLPGHIKSYNPNIKLFEYTNATQIDSGNDPALQWIRDKLSSEKGGSGKGDWWLKKADGSNISTWKNRWRINLTANVTKDASGLRWPQWFARYWRAAPSDSGSWVAPAGVNRGRGLREGAWDGVYADDQSISYAIGADADYDNDGDDDLKWDAATREWVMAGHTAYRDAWKSLEPNWLFTGNMSLQISNRETPLPTSLQQVYDGGHFERIMTTETFGGWSAMMESYQRGMAYLRSPKIGMFHADLSVLRESYPTSGFSDYRWNRYSLASCLMDNGYYVVTISPGYQEVAWFDEFDIDLGYPVDPPPTTAWNSGVYRREFDNGLVLVNPKGNGARTVNIGQGWKRFQGQQDPAYNNGQAVTSITLDEQDGIVLVRENAKPRPEPPQLLPVQ